MRAWILTFMSFIVSDELVQKITPKSYAGFSRRNAGQLVGERILLAANVVGGLENRLNKCNGFKDFNLFERERFLEELAKSISYDDYDAANPSSLKNDSFFSEIVDLVKRDLYQYLKQNEVKYHWGYVKASNHGDVLVSPKI